MTQDNIYALTMYAAMCLVIGVGCYVIRKKCCRLQGKYDERQKIIQGAGYKYGFFATIISGMLYAMACSIWEVPVHPAVAVTACVFLGIGVFMSYCVWKDAYFGLAGNSRRYVVLMAACVIVNSAAVVSHMLEGTLVENGVVGIDAMNVLCALLFLAMLIVILLKNGRTAGSQFDEEGED